MKQVTVDLITVARTQLSLMMRKSSDPGITLRIQYISAKDGQPPQVSFWSLADSATRGILGGGESSA